MALTNGCLPFELDGKALKDELIRQGRNLVEFIPNRVWDVQATQTEGR